MKKPKHAPLFLYQTTLQIKEFAKARSEHDLRLKVKDAFFADYPVNVEDERVDFLVSQKDTPLLWAESKSKTTGIHEMFAQLLLTIKRKKIDSGEHLPAYLGVFDKEKIAFTEYHNALTIFHLNDFNWNERPSSVSQETIDKVGRHLKNVVEYRFENDTAEIIEFIRTNFVSGNTGTAKAQINKNNFVAIYDKWGKEVSPSIGLSVKQWKKLRKVGVGNCDFYLADLLSEDNKTISDKLNVVLQTNYYKSKVKEDDAFDFLYTEVGFNDRGEAHAKFWARYERPPKQEYHKYIIERRDLLVPKDLRERRGAFFTPPVWVRKSQEYLEKVFGKKWQDEYYVWDCCAGTCNLLAGLKNPHGVWASTLDQPDVDIVHENIANNEINLLPAHVFQFDFLNDDFSKLPKSLRDIVLDDEKRKKLIIYMNPPYAEGGSSRQMSKTGKYKTDIEKNATHDKYHSLMAGANREIFAQFLMRLHCEIPGCKIAHFSTLKSLTGPHFNAFRANFKAKLKSLFICRADTFDNVYGQFPIGFFIWDTNLKQSFKRINADVFDHEGNHFGKKPFFSSDHLAYFSKWVNTFKKDSGIRLGWLEGMTRNDFQHNSIIFFLNHKEQMAVPRGMAVYDGNFVECCVGFAVRHCIPHTWINHNDQFLYPNDGYKKDAVFQNDCLIFTLFHEKNRICSNGGENPWLPFTAEEVNAKDNFQSTLMSDFLKTRKKMSREAKAVYNAGKALWTYYHESIKLMDKACVDASLYEIREYFKGRDSQGKMKTKSADARFHELDSELRATLKTLAARIQPKVFEYGFLRE